MIGICVALLMTEIGLAFGFWWMETLVTAFLLIKVILPHILVFIILAKRPGKFFTWKIKRAFLYLILFFHDIVLLKYIFENLNSVLLTAKDQKSLDL